MTMNLRPNFKLLQKYATNFWFNLQIPKFRLYAILVIALVLYPPETLKNLWFFDGFRGVDKEVSGMNWVNKDF